MTQTVKHIVCPNCDATNRVPVGKNPKDAKCGSCHQPLFTGHPTPVTAASFAKHIKGNDYDIPVLVDFWAQWCGPCRAMAPIFEKLAAELEPQIRFLKVDTEAEPALAAQYDIRSIPALMLFRRGAVVAERAGASDANSLWAWILQHLQPVA